jgi:mono/diheme cytochrome c family protein
MDFHREPKASLAGRLARRLGRVLLALVLAAAPATASQSGAAQSTPAAEASRSKALYDLHCVQCHGETGDGRGTTKLDRPARSFRDGGFSFGNTREALVKTIAHGIPGSQMPAFEGALKPEERALLADYVLGFAPESARAPQARGSEMVVGARPLVARGKLPAIEGHAAQRVRGLLLADPSGLSFEFDAADLRLLVVRRGAFVERGDWENRGGDALRPLGRIVSRRGLLGAGWLLRGPDGASSILRAELVATRVDGAHPKLEYDLRDERGATLARVVEALGTANSKAGAGFARRLWIEARSPVELALDVAPHGLSALVEARAHAALWSLDAGAELCVARGLDEGERLQTERGEVRIVFGARPERPRWLAVESYPLATLDAAARAALQEESR